MTTIKDLNPKVVWDHFDAICQVPRPSKREEKIIAFLLDFAEKNGIEAKRDTIGNVVMRKPATPGMESKPTVILQSHMDMVCEKNNDKVHDFDKDPIIPVVDGEWVRADNTTLGADCGIGMAAQMAVLTDKDIQHGPVECLFTVDEETGLTGAMELEDDMLTGKILLNLDSEDDGEIFIGCAGGIDTLADFNYDKEAVDPNMFPLSIEIKGLLGGHSGDEINKGRANANQLLVRFLWAIAQDYDLRIAHIDGGNLRNAIAREASASIMVPKADKEDIIVRFNIFRSEMEHEWEMTEPNLRMDIGSAEAPAYLIDKDTQFRLLNALMCCPHGVLAMSYRMPGMVETSTNLASVKFRDDKIHITTSQRSDINSGKIFAASKVESVFRLAGANVKHSDGYPGWAPNPESPIMKVVRDSYTALFGQEPEVKSIHAGLECGLFLTKYPQLDMVSFGPTIRLAHSPMEKIEIKTVEKFWAHLLDVLQKL
ncbi:aminoacyl-histidine dipeptidase [Halosquirtibacter xylanolyticus]|uniref:aminoacyl-histidine dipeptidase n=1 Tax=Halosquirtibacter xylanolyticus TaxID=3374599 RepID=UPI003747EDBF|nr:aminoacyl-histidine dipeptidase [Prolixibacteraceae bacterium]